MANTEDISRYIQNLQKEIDGSYLYGALAASEKQPEMAELYQRLAASETRHANAWEKRIKEAGLVEYSRKVSLRARILAWLAKRFGPQFVIPTITSNERADSSSYDNQPEAETSAMSADERSHARLLMSIGSSRSGLSGGMVAQMEGRHRTGGGNALRAAVLGANDGLVSILSLVMGVAGANLPSHDVFIAGIAGLLAGAGSMALGEWLSVQSSRELYLHQISIEKAELERDPHEEQEELALIYQAKGLSEARARELSVAIMTTEQDSILDTLSREELGIDPKELGGSAYVAATTSFFLFSLGALFPLLPFAFLSGNIAVYTSMGVSALALFLVGAAITLMTGSSCDHLWYRSVDRRLHWGMKTFSP
jgi:VIT1/CCC1 family predicted Fe2+/Mn2+ transporter